MKALIIAAGNGSRLIQEGSENLKPLVRINGRVMIERLIKILELCEFSEVHIITNEKSIEVMDFVKSLNTSIKIGFMIKDTPSSLHSLYELNKANSNEPFYLFTVDSIFKINEFQEFCNYCENNTKTDAIMGITSYIDDEKPLYVKLNGELINEFLDNNEECEYVTGGLYYFRTSIKEYLEIAVESGIFRLRNFLRLLIVNNKKIGSYKFSKIIDVDHINDIRKAEEFVKNENLFN